MCQKVKYGAERDEREGAAVLQSCRAAVRPKGQVKVKAKVEKERVLR